jgi:hypothetical protein
LSYSFSPVLLVIFERVSIFCPGCPGP